MSSECTQMQLPQTWQPFSKRHCCAVDAEVPFPVSGLDQISCLNTWVTYTVLCPLVFCSCWVISSSLSSCHLGLPFPYLHHSNAWSVIHSSFVNHPIIAWSEPTLPSPLFPIAKLFVLFGINTLLYVLSPPFSSARILVPRSVRVLRL